MDLWSGLLKLSSSLKTLQMFTIDFIYFYYLLRLGPCAITLIVHIMFSDFPVLFRFSLLKIHFSFCLLPISLWFSRGFPPALLPSWQFLSWRSSMCLVSMLAFSISSLNCCIHGFAVSSFCVSKHVEVFLVSLVYGIYIMTYVCP